MLSVATLLVVGRTNQHMKFQVHICNMHGLPIFDAQPHCNLGDEAFCKKESCLQVFNIETGKSRPGFA